MEDRPYSFGPSLEGNQFRISTYSPLKEKLSLYVSGDEVPMERSHDGFWTAYASRELEGSSYGFLVDGKGPFPDPGGRYMPAGIHGLSKLINIDDYLWTQSSWKGLEIGEYILEEVHVGTFTEGGTYKTMEEKLDHLSELGITAVEIMPVSEFYGTRNWGYDCVYLYSPHFTYGEPKDLMHVVDAIHSRGMCAVLDVVYNHGGPVGNYLEKFAPFYNRSYFTPWGNCFNLDGEYSDHIREYILQNAIYWLKEYRFDALRLDAVHGIIDHSPVHILEEMARRVRELSKESGRNIYLIAESDMNDGRLARPAENCGVGISAQWNDDFHHVLHTALTGEQEGYYMDYCGFEDMESLLTGGFLYRGQYSRYLKRRRGTPWDNSMANLVVCSQNHDQVGNRANGDRLVTLAGLEKTKLAATLTLLSPFTPLLFMGEEFGASSPFLFFMQTEDQSFAENVYEGRIEEFRKFNWGEGTPDPSRLETFQRSKVRWEESKSETGTGILKLYSDLILARKSVVLNSRDRFTCNTVSNKLLEISYGTDLMAFLSFSENPVNITIEGDHWSTFIDTSWVTYAGYSGVSSQLHDTYKVRPYSAVVLVNRALIPL